jgi:Fe-Mn family superoxide dismutase
MAFEVPPLPYDYNALEPTIDDSTMHLHHDKHHQAYVDKVNAALEGTEWADRPIEDVLRNLDQIPDNKRNAVRNNGGGHYNHTLFWEIMGPGGGGDPTGQIGTAINAVYGDYPSFKDTLTKAAVGQFGSGWGWLVKDTSGNLTVISRPNQDTPLSEGMTVILGVDVWEHAYYLKYQNKRPDYVAAWFNTINWDAVNKRFGG